MIVGSFVIPHPLFEEIIEERGVEKKKNGYGCKIQEV